MTNGKLSRQDVIDRVKEYFSRPGAVLAQFPDPEAARGKRCVYRGDNDPHSPVRCAVGCLIPDELYRSEMEDKTADAVLDSYPELTRRLFGTVTVRSFLSAIQTRHDSADTVEEFLDSLRIFAMAKGLNF